MRDYKSIKQSHDSGGITALDKLRIAGEAVSLFVVFVMILASFAVLGVLMPEPAKNMPPVVAEVVAESIPHK